MKEVAVSHELYTTGHLTARYSGAYQNTREENQEVVGTREVDHLITSISHSEPANQLRYQHIRSTQINKQLCQVVE